MVGTVKNIEHPKLTFSSPKEEDEHSRHFQRGVPHPFHQPQRGQALQQGGAKGNELELHISF